MAYLSSHPDEPITLAALGRRLGMSPFHLQRTFRRLTGLSPKEYVGALRRERLKAALRDERTVTAAVYQAGYGSSSRAYGAPSAELGMTPAVYKDGGRGMRIRYAIVSSEFGEVLVGATERGVCHVSLGDDPSRLEARLRREYPNARVEPATNGLRGWARAVLRYVDEENGRVRVPLDVPGTPFQWKVWKALQRIPYGRTRTYREVAASIGKPTAARAVARACATNRVSLVVPCHRVVRTDGGLGGYEWGVDRKRKLLAHEASRASKAKSTSP